MWSTTVSSNCSAPHGGEMVTSPRRELGSEPSAQVGIRALGPTIRSGGTRNRVTNRRVLPHEAIRVRGMDGTLLCTISSTYAACPQHLAGKIAQELQVHPEVMRVVPTESPSDVTAVFDVACLKGGPKVEAWAHSDCDMCGLLMQYGGTRRPFYPIDEDDAGCDGWKPSERERATHSPQVLGLLFSLSDQYICWSPGCRFCEACWVSKSYIFCHIPEGPLGDAIAEEVCTVVGAPKGCRRHRWIALLDIAFRQCDEERALKDPGWGELNKSNEERYDIRWATWVKRHAPDVYTRVVGTPALEHPCRLPCRLCGPEAFWRTTCRHCAPAPSFISSG